MKEDGSRGEKVRRKKKGGELVSLLKYNGVISAAARESEGRGVSFKREVFLSVLN